MSIRSAFKSKFKNSFDREGPSARDVESTPLLMRTEQVEEEGPDGAPGEFKECFEEDTLMNQTNGGHQASIQSTQLEGASYRPLSEGAPPSRSGGKFSDRDEKADYELQLTQLQEQLVAAMIESQNLGGTPINYILEFSTPMSSSLTRPSSPAEHPRPHDPAQHRGESANEVKALKEKPEVDRLKQQIDSERERNRILANQLREGRTKPSTLYNSDDEDLFSATRRPLRKRLKLKERSASASDFTDINQEGFVEVKKEDLFDKHSEQVHQSEPQSRLHDWLLSTFYDLIEDFTEVCTETEPQQENEGEPLTAKQLKDNMKRFYASGRPVMATMKSIRSMLSWETPSMTILVLILYVYSVWLGWLFPVTLFLIIIRLAINWLKSKGLITNFHYLPREDEKEEADDKDGGVSDKFVLVLQVARKVQNGLGDLADSLEKLQNLLMWHHPTATRQLLLFLLVMFLASCLLSGKLLFQIIGIYFALKLFVIDYIYERYPRVRLRHDTTLRLWRELPTNAELSQRTTRAQLDQYILPVSPREESESPVSVEAGGSDLSSDDRNFLQLFNLPASESPLPVWTGGRRCTLINRERSLTSAFKSGKLYLTRSFLCFERTKSASPKNLIIPLGDITKIEKAKPYSWMPGGGMALEVHVGGVSKPLMFGALLNRDEIFESIMSVGMKAALLWAPGATPLAPPDNSQSTPSSPTQTKGPMVDKLKLGIQYIEDSD